MITCAVYKDGRVMHISEVSRGLDCGCKCEDCRKRLVARKGTEVSHHFAHYDSTNCKGEGNLHRMAKEIFLKHKRIILKDPVTKRDVNVSFISGEAEAYKEPLRIDALMIADHPSRKELAVEFKVRHAVDTKKKLRLREMNLGCVEVDISHLTENDVFPSIDLIRKEICAKSRNTKWIYNEKWERHITHELVEKFKTLLKKKKNLENSILLNEKENQGNMEMKRMLVEKVLVHVDEEFSNIKHRLSLRGYPKYLSKYFDEGNDREEELEGIPFD